jgi:DTW domain-containing protein YfiP
MPEPNETSVAEVADCPRCGKPQPLCICDSVTPIENKTSLLILQHPQEQDRALGTARLAARQFKGAVVRIGLSWPSLSKALGRPVTDPSRWAVLYLGSAKVAELDTDAEIVAIIRKGELEADQRGYSGGTWSQAKALWWRNPWMLKCRRVILDPRRPSRYGALRREPRRDGCLNLPQGRSRNSARNGIVAAANAPDRLGWDAVPRARPGVDSHSARYRMLPFSGPTVVQVHGQGPFAITYMDPADDPRNQDAPGVEAAGCEIDLRHVRCIARRGAQPGGLSSCDRASVEPNLHRPWRAIKAFRLRPESASGQKQKSYAPDAMQCCPLPDSLPDQFGRLAVSPDREWRRCERKFVVFEPNDAH